MAALKLTLLVLMQRVLMTKHHQKWQLERAPTHSAGNVLPEQGETSQVTHC